ncbi:MAG: dUTP diphosphatase [Candidatus Metalachnospira sp.]|nr:dUTP diphosphatase [Candidatus Metalachnospira sp.]
MEKNFYIVRTDDAGDLSLPKYMSEGAAGMDIYANVHIDTIIKTGEIKLIPTGIKISLPEGFEAQIRPRSGLALKNGITLVNTPGTIDSDYRGEIGVILINHGDRDFLIKRGDRIAQMVINKYERVEWTETDTLDKTERADGGFGHSGV